MFPKFHREKSRLLAITLGFLTLTSTSKGEGAWWDNAWTMRKKITLDTGATGAGIATPIGTTTVLVRLSDANFQFAYAKEDGADLRFVAEDNKTLLPYHVERWDTVFNEGIVWVKVTDLKPSTATSFWIYFGNQAPTVTRADDAKGSYDEGTVGVYHLSENNSPPADVSATLNAGDKAAAPVPGAIAGGGIRLNGQTPITFQGVPAIAWTDGGSMTWSAWIKPSALRARSILFSRREGANAFLIGEDNGVVFAEVTGTGGTQRTPAAPPLAVNVWRHLAVTAGGNAITIYLDGENYATLAAPLPALAGPWALGKDSVEAGGFFGELDQVELSNVARTPGWLKFSAVNQGTSPEAAKLLTAGADESSGAGEEHESEIAKHLTLLTDISKSLTIDGWVVIVLCVILAVVGWGVGLFKLLYLIKINKASKVFIRQWKQISTDITALDHADEASVKSMGGASTDKDQILMKESPLFHLYHLGSQEIQHRIDTAKGNFQGLSERSIGAIRAVLDSGQSREVQKLNDKLVFLTIGIAGGPYLGLLGTVIGVMITFAVIAKSGEVEINSIAPGIAGALLATVAGLAVAIPALFAYSYLSSRIKVAITNMHSFIDEFIARIAEAYPSTHD